MRPGIFTPENPSLMPRRWQGCIGASMRPGIFTPENITNCSIFGQGKSSFNEAGDFHPRKHEEEAEPSTDLLARSFNEAGDFHPRKRRETRGCEEARAASMRPGIFTPENISGCLAEWTCNDELQ